MASIAIKNLDKLVGKCRQTAHHTFFVLGQFITKTQVGIEILLGPDLEQFGIELEIDKHDLASFAT